MVLKRSIKLRWVVRCAFRKLRVWLRSNGCPGGILPWNFQLLNKIGIFLIIKPTRCTNFSNLFLEWNSKYFGQFLCPASGVFHCTHNNGLRHTGLLTACEQEQMLRLTSYQQTCMTYTIAVCTVKNSWWWTEELSEICRVSFHELLWEIRASSWFNIRNDSREGLPQRNFLLGSYGCQLHNIPDTATSTALLLELIATVRLLIRLCTEKN